MTVGLTPALQRVMLFDRYTPGEVNRARATAVCAAGKAVNAARAARTWDVEGQVTAITRLGGPSGQRCAAEMAAAGIQVVDIGDTHETRTCVTILERATGTVTELVEGTSAAGDGDVPRMVREVAAGGMEVVVCSGSLPVGAEVDAYARVVEAAQAAAVIVDAAGPALVAALKFPSSGARVAKVNRGELRDTLGTEDPRALLAAGATHVVVTDGPRGVWASDGKSAFHAVPPPVTVVNTTGCGDCLAGVLAAAWGGSSFQEAVVAAVAASAASAGWLLPAQFDAGQARALAARVRVSPC